MAIEAKRGCGYRKVGGLYLMGQGLGAPCDRLPLPIVPCPTCGEQLRFHRSISAFNPAHLWGPHTNGCHDSLQCFVCYPAERGYLMWVGKDYTPQSFITEALSMGVSKRIAAMPSELQLGVDRVWLAYKDLMPTVNTGWTLPLEGVEKRRGFKPGIFYVFTPLSYDYIVSEAQSKDTAKMDELRAKGITPVVVPDDDPDHRARKGR